MHGTHAWYTFRVVRDVEDHDFKSLSATVSFSVAPSSGGKQVLQSTPQRLHIPVAVIGKHFF